MKKHPCLGRPGAEARAARRAHARKLVLTLLGISRRLCRLQPEAEARAAHREVEQALRKMLGRPPGAATRGK